MTPRVARLREQSLSTAPWLSHERALLLTEFYEQAPAASVPMTRALAFAHLMEHKAIYIGEGELIVGERGPSPKGTPTYPELCCHTLEDLDVLHTREKISYRVCDEARAGLSRSRSSRSGAAARCATLLFAQMTPEWKAAYEAGVFTEFMEQRAPGHTVLDDKIYQRGFGDFSDDIDRALAALDPLRDPLAYDKAEELRAMRPVRRGDRPLRRAPRRARPRRWPRLEPDPGAARRARAHGRGLRARARARAAHLPGGAAGLLVRSPRRHHRAQHLGLVQPGPSRPAPLSVLPRAASPPARSRDEAARELLECFWVKFNNQPAPPKVGVTAAESGTYTDFANINNGGLTPDGADGVNDLTYLVLDVIDEMRLLQPSSNIQVSRKNPDRFLRRAVRGHPQGLGPALDLQRRRRRRGAAAAGQVARGRAGGRHQRLRRDRAPSARKPTSSPATSTCRRCSSSRSTTASTRPPARRVGVATGDAGALRDLRRRVGRVRDGSCATVLRLKIRGNQRHRAPLRHAHAGAVPVDPDRRLHREAAATTTPAARATTRPTSCRSASAPSPTACRRCASRVRRSGDRTDGRARSRRWRATSTATKRMRQRLWNKTPRYGNDDADADGMLSRVFDAFRRHRRRPAEHARRRLSRQLPVDDVPRVLRVEVGRDAGRPARARAGLGRHLAGAGHRPARPDRRAASAAHMDHARTGGTLLNQKFTPDAAGERGRARPAGAARAVVLPLGGHHIQFNVVTAETLRDAQAHPEKHRDLIVRVAGYSDYFCDLTRPLQDEIIARTEHSVL